MSWVVPTDQGGFRNPRRKKDAKVRKCGKCFADKAPGVGPGFCQACKAELADLALERRARRERKED